MDTIKHPTMIRTQIQFTEPQLRALRELAARRGASISELVREAVNTLTAAEALPSRDERRRRAIAAAGRFRSGRNDVSSRHDDYLFDAYGNRDDLR
jgi:hypothetical protein